MRWEPSIELQDRHAMCECPCGAGEVGVANNGLIDREGSAAFDAGREHVRVRTWVETFQLCGATATKAEIYVAERAGHPIA
jgi:hypothetical protein